MPGEDDPQRPIREDECRPEDGFPLFIPKE